MSFTHGRFLLEAIEQCHLFKIITYIKYGQNIYIRNNLDQNLLIHTLKQQQHTQNPLFEKKRLQVFQFLITHCHLDLHTFDVYGKNVFNWATNLNCTQEALYLLRTYAGDIDILKRDHSGLCSLHYAIEHGNEILVQAIVNYLLQYRIRFDIKDNYNNTPEELARKLGYDNLADYLEITSRSTVFLSREIPFSQQRLMTNKTSRTVNTKSSTNTLTSSSSFDSTEFHNLIESKIEAARNSNNWKTVAMLRSHKRISNEKKINSLKIPTIQINRPTTISVLPKISPINIASLSSSGGESVHMLHLLEPQICSSYRQAFVPTQHQTIIPNISHLPSSTVQRRTSITSSHRTSSILNHRKRDSNTGQFNGSILQDGQTRLSLPPIYKQHRQSLVPGRLSDGVGATKIRSKHMVPVHN